MFIYDSYCLFNLISNMLAAACQGIRKFNRQRIAFLRLNRLGKGQSVEPIFLMSLIIVQFKAILTQSNFTLKSMK